MLRQTRWPPCADAWDFRRDWTKKKRRLRHRNKDQWLSELFERRRIQAALGPARCAGCASPWEKQWRIWNAEIANPTEEWTNNLKVNASLPPDQVIELTPGDVLFIPRGEPHSAAVSTVQSVHLTIGLSSLTGLNFIDHLRKEAAKDLFLRMNLLRHSSEEEALMHEAGLKRRLHQLIDAASVTKFLRANDLDRRPPANCTLRRTAANGRRRAPDAASAYSSPRRYI